MLKINKTVFKNMEYKKMQCEWHKIHVHDLYHVSVWN